MTFRNTLWSLSCGFFLLLGKGVNAQINITPNQTAAVLAQTLAGEGVQVFNATLDCAGNANGIFNIITSNLGVDSGIVLTSGQAVTQGTAIGINEPANSSGSTSTVNETGNDPDLDTLSKVRTFDRCVLEFDFIPSGDTIKFKYVFGSEEYPEFACANVNDVFGFFISGPGITGPFSNNSVNIALVPGTNIPVTINSINNAPTGTTYPISVCNAMGAGSPFSAYYRNNSASTTIMYDGLTTILTAVKDVTPCETYHLKLAIADGGDAVYDSGVFLEKGSLTSPSATVKPQFGGGLPYAVRNCYPGYFEFTRPYATPSPFKIKYMIGGTAVNGVDYMMIPDSITIPSNQASTILAINGLQTPTPTGPVIVKLYIFSNTCDLSQADIVDSAEVVIYDEIQLELENSDTTICQYESVQIRANGDSTLTFEWSPTTGLSDANIWNPVATLETTTTYSITASFPPSGCPPVTRSFTVNVEPIPIISLNPHDTSFCLRDPYLLDANVEPSSFQQYTYSWSPTSDLDNPDILKPYFFTRLPGDYKYVLTVNTPVGCSSSDSVFITARPSPTLIDVTEDFTAKYGDKVQLNADGATYYTWTPTRLLDYPNHPDPTATATDTVTFRVIGTDKYGCRDTAFVHMNIDYTMNEWIPNAFSPNGDGRNDIFSVKNMKFQRLIEFRIFNRWGQEIYSTTDPNLGWDGTYKGIPQETGVYHYLIRITTPDGQQRAFKGDVSLLR